MKVHLIENWSDQFGFEADKRKHIFIGRENEIKSLVYVLNNNSSSTILVSSVRGVGKTSFIHRALSEITDDMIPIFVNVGHTLGESKGKEGIGRDFLTSLIRSVFLTKDFCEDDTIKELYHQSIGEFKKGKELSDSSNVTKSISILAEVKKTVDENQFRTGLVALSASLITLSIFSETMWIKLVGLLGLVSMPFSLTVKSKWGLEKIISKFNNSHDSYLIDNSTEYLETKFEKWLEEKSKTSKIVFVIDELDRDDVTEAFKAIKEYKNLFTRSFAHFIFICNQEAYELVGESRLKSKNPTLFTHVYYLPTPTSEEMNEYLDKIFASKESSKEVEELKKFLLFKSANDFFSLKNLVNDLSGFDSKGSQYIDLETIREIDKNYSESAIVYKYINAFYQYYSRKPKFFWNANSGLQAEVFSFANKNIMKDFSIDVNTSNQHVQKLVFFLERIGVILRIPLVADDGHEIEVDSVINYTWTRKFRNIDSFVQLFSEDENFIDAMENLIMVANDLDDLPTNYHNSAFKAYNSVTPGSDGSNFSEITLADTYLKYKDLYKNVKNPDDRIYARAKDAEEAAQEINTDLKNITLKTFNIFSKVLEEVVESENKEISKTSIQTGVSPYFDIKSWEKTFSGRLSCLFYNESTGKQVLVISSVYTFLNFGREKALAELRSNKDILVLNFVGEGKTKINLDIHPSVKRTAAGHNRKKAVTVQNFFNYNFPMDIRSLAEPLALAVKHLKS